MIVLVFIPLLHILVSSTPFSGQEDQRAQSATRWQVRGREIRPSGLSSGLRIDIACRHMKERLMTFPSEKGNGEQKHEDSTTSTQLAKDFNIVPIPSRLRYHEGKIFPFGIPLNAWFGVASTFGG